jgi:predicted acylesterase/phospholipase RssA
VVGHADGTETVVNELGRGEIVGEMALLTDSPRSATIVALRDSHVFFLSSDAYARVVQAYPAALRAISKALINKLMHTIHHGPVASPARNIAIVPLDESADVRELGDRLAAALERLLGSAVAVRARDMRDALGARPSRLDRAVWRDQLEAVHGAVVHIADADANRDSANPDAGDWTDECLQQADLVVLAASAGGSTALRPIEVELDRRRRSVAPRTELVLLHPPATSTPRGTRYWLEPRAIDRHHHVRVDRPGDYERVARMLVGRGVGVVFSGGGARGIAHVGVLRALLARGITSAATAGASLGAIVGGAVARGDAPDVVASQIRAAVVDRSPVDLTFPSVSIAAGGRVTQHIKEGAQGLDLEDAWLNFVCVSTNLTRGALEVHRRGPAWAAVRSSFSVPGLFPPMRNAEGDVLVDGGLLSNLPVSTLRAEHAGINVIAVDVGAPREFMSGKLPDSGVVSGWRFLLNNVRQRSLDNLTSLPRVLMRLTELGSLGDDDLGDCYIRLEMPGVSLLDFDRFDDLVAMGADDAARTLDEWLAARDQIDLTAT